MEVPPGYSTHQVCVVMSNTGLEPFSVINAAKQLVRLNKTLENIVGVYLTEYFVDPAAGNTSFVWRLSLGGSGMEESTSCNANGQGHPFVVRNLVTAPPLVAANPTHVTYDSPRAVSFSPQRGLTMLNVSVQQSNGAAPFFNTMSFFLTFVLKDKEWDSKTAKNDDEVRHLEWWRSQAYAGRFHM